jgi:hypothetical protein
MTGKVWHHIEEDTKRYNIRAFWDEFDIRIAFLDELVRMGRFHEAFTLCVTYLDGVSAYLAGDGVKNGLAFCQALADHEDRPYYSLVHPLQFIRAAEKLNGPWPGIAKKLDQHFDGPIYTLLTGPHFVSTVTPLMTAVELGEIRSNLWRGTLGAVVDYWIRNPYVHRLGGVSTISFGQSTWNGQPCSSISLPELVPVLRRMTSAARIKSDSEMTLP